MDQTGCERTCVCVPSPTALDAAAAGAEAEAAEARRETQGVAAAFDAAKSALEEEMRAVRWDAEAVRGALAATLAADERRSNADAVAAKHAGKRALRVWQDPTVCTLFKALSTIHTVYHSRRLNS